MFSKIINRRPHFFKQNKHSVRLVVGVLRFISLEHSQEHIIWLGSIFLVLFNYLSANEARVNDWETSTVHLEDIAVRLNSWRSRVDNFIERTDGTKRKPKGVTNNMLSSSQVVSFIFILSFAVDTNFIANLNVFGIVNPRFQNIHYTCVNRSAHASSLTRFLVNNIYHRGFF